MDAIELHRKSRGKISVCPKVDVKNMSDMSMVYTPGVADVSRAIAADKKSVYELTIKPNTVAVVSDGSAVLGLGNIGPEAAIPVMEGKALLFKQFACIDAFPICLGTQDADEIIRTVKYISPVFGGINLEDISAPRCFYIEEHLQDIGIPVMHDDQHGTAIVVSAALRNAAKIVGKDFEELNVAISGAGAAGTAVARMLLCDGFDGTGVKGVVMCDSKGVIYKGRTDLNDEKIYLSKITNKRSVAGTLSDAMKGADVFIGVSKAGIVTKDMVSSMGENAIVFAMANPVPEIMPADAIEAGAAVVGTGRSDFPNQINNSLGFPGVFRGALDAGATRINNEMKIAASVALARTIEPTKERVLPNIFDANVVKNISAAVKKAAIETGVVRK